MKNWRMMKVARTLGAPSIGIKISGQWVLTRPSESNIRYSGMIVTSFGTSRPASTTRKTTPAPRNLIRAKA